MSFQDHPYFQVLLQQASTSSLLQKQLQSSQNPLIIPPFPVISNQELFGHKRPNAYLLDQSSKDEAIPIKKIKVDSYNMLFKPDFSERESYYSKPNSAESSPSEKKSTVSYKQLNDQIAADKRISINFSTKPKARKMRLSSLEIHPSPNDFSLALPLAKGLAHGAVHNKAHMRNPRAPLYDLICKKLEENCCSLMNQMQGLMVLSQNLRQEKNVTPLLNFNLAETQPGTPNSATNRNLREIKFNAMVERKDAKRKGLEEASPKSC